MYKIYLAKHLPSDSVYVGITKGRLMTRIGQHLHLATYKRERFQKFLHTTEYNDWTWDVIEEVEDREKAYGLENVYIKDYASRHNSLNTVGVTKSKPDPKHLKPYQFKKGQVAHNKGKTGEISDETRQKMREAKLRNPVVVDWTDDMREEMRARQKNRKPVQCIETGDVFMSQSEACKKMGLTRSNLRNHLKGVYKTVKGYTFRFVEET